LGLDSTSKKSFYGFFANAVPYRVDFLDRFEDVVHDAAVQSCLNKYTVGGVKKSQISSVGT